jgi:hypothetical protein
MAAIALIVGLFFVVGIAVGVIGIVTFAVVRQDRSRSRRSGKAGIGAASLFDPTGAAVYGLLRGDLAVRDGGSSATEVFQASARTVADAYEEAVQDSHQTGTKRDNL